jgi:hypothetical protein
MERSRERSFCCGAGGARMWMEETIGERINVNRTREAVATGADQIAVGCPFCRVMLSDGLTAEQTDGNAREEVEVLDVAQMLLASVKGESATRAASAPAAATARRTETKAEPEPGDVTQTPDTVTATEDVGPAAAASAGSSLFDLPATEEKPAEGAPAAPSGSLFDVAEPATQEPVEEAASSGSLFDLPATEPEAKATPPKAEPPKVEPPAEIPSGSLFDLPEPEPAAGHAGDQAAEVPSPSAQHAVATPGLATRLPDDVSLFDLGDEAAPASTPESKPEAEEPRKLTDGKLDEATSLFDL